MLYFEPYTSGITEIYDLYQIDSNCNYLKIAQVSPEGEMTFYSDVSEEDKNRITEFADAIKERIQQSENQNTADTGEEETPEISGISM